MKKIKILHTEWSDGWGGQEIRIINEMIAVRECGIDVVLVCRENSKIRQKANELNIKVFCLPFKGNMDFVTLFHLVKIIKKEKIDIVNTHSGKDTWVGGIAAKLAGVKFIRTRHLSNKINQSRLNFINGLADFIFTTGESVRDDMILSNRILPNKIKSIPTGIDEQIYNPCLYNKSCSRLKYNIQDDEIAIVNVGVLRSFKRHDIFIEIAKKIMNTFKNLKFKFIIAGEGPQRMFLEEQILKLNLQGSVFLIGHIDNVPEFLSAGDIFLFTSDSKEGVPQSIIQALLMEKIVIATNVGSTKDLFNGTNFHLIDFGIDSIYNCLIDVLENKIECKINRQYIVDNFSKSIMTQNIISMYKVLLNEK